MRYDFYGRGLHHKLRYSIVARVAATDLLKEDARSTGRGVELGMTDALTTQIPVAPAEAFGRRIQRSLQVILAGLDERGELSAPDTEDLRRDLRRLLQRERIEISAAEMDKAEWC